MSTTTVYPSSPRLRNAGHWLRASLGVLAIFAALMLGANLSLAGGVLDGAGFFSEQAKVDAGKVIGEMERTLHKDLTVETFKEIPADQKAGVDVKDKAALGRVFQQWATKQAQQKRVNGVYVLIAKEPSHLEIVVGTDTQRAAFTLADRDALKTLMLGKLRAHQYDDALRDGVNFVSATMRSHAGNHARTGTAPVPVNSRPAQQSHSSTGWLIPAIVIGLVAWLVIGIVRALSGRMGGGGAMGQPSGGGGGFLSSLVGGMFGAAAGMWMYDQFFSSHGSNSAYGSDRNDQSGGDSGFSGQDSDYTSSGDDFGGNDSGGSDSGGGGDFGGGGDSGGGGDF